MPKSRTTAILALTLLCFGCTQARGPQYTIGAYQPPPSVTPSEYQPVTFQDTQSDGFTTTTGDTITTAGGDEINTTLATGIAVVGLVALLILADDITAGSSGDEEVTPSE